MSTIKIGLFGFGVVGEGIYQVLSAKPQLGAVIKKIVIKHPDKQRNAPEELFSTDPDAILEDEEIDLVVELIDDAEAAKTIVLKALNSGKSVISANKKLIAENLEELISIAKKNNVSFLYEAAACGSIPVIRNLEEYFDNDLITSFKGIVNGSTNYILTQMAQKGLDYHTALAKAQELGFAESDPRLDVEGWDARNKLKILALHAFGKVLRDEDIQVKGIDSLSKFDVDYAKEKKLVIKLIANCKVNADGDIEEASVFPVFLPRFHPLRLTDNEFNGIVIGGELSDEQFLYGKGAGRYPTSSAVLSDISAFKFNYRYEYRKGLQNVEVKASSTRKFYVRYPKKLQINFEELGTIQENYQSENDCYTTLTGANNRILTLTKNKGVSVIGFE